MSNEDLAELDPEQQEEYQKQMIMYTQAMMTKQAAPDHAVSLPEPSCVTLAVTAQFNSAGLVSSQAYSSPFDCAESGRDHLCQLVVDSSAFMALCCRSVLLLLRLLHRSNGSGRSHTAGARKRR